MKVKLIKLQFTNNLKKLKKKVKINLPLGYRDTIEVIDSQ